MLKCIWQGSYLDDIFDIDTCEIGNAKNFYERENENLAGNLSFFKTA